MTAMPWFTSNSKGCSALHITERKVRDSGLILGVDRVGGRESESEEVSLASLLFLKSDLICLADPIQN
jgi:hypothetical protein